MTYQQAVEEAAQRFIDSQPSTEAKQEILAQLLGDPEVMDLLLERPKDRRVLFTALLRGDQRRNA